MVMGVSIADIFVTASSPGSGETPWTVVQWLIVIQLPVVLHDRSVVYWLSQGMYKTYLMKTYYVMKIYLKHLTKSVLSSNKYIWASYRAGTRVLHQGVPVSQLMMMSMWGQDCLAGVLYLSIKNLTWAEIGWGAIVTTLLMTEYAECVHRRNPLHPAALLL